jgi:hypothetical protein
VLPAAVWIPSARRLAARWPPDNSLFKQNLRSAEMTLTVIENFLAK